MLDEKFKNKGQDVETQVMVVNGDPVLAEALDVCHNKKRNLHFLRENVLTPEVFEILESNKIDLLIVDVSAEENDGINITNQIRIKYPSKPIIILYIENEKGIGSKIRTKTAEQDPTVQKVASEMLQVLDYADALLQRKISGFTISLTI